MISVQPIQLWRYLGFRKNKLKKGLKRMFYLSYEDALWDLMEKKNISTKSLVLVPEFFCGDVENNIKSHGYRVISYKMCSSLKVDLNDFNKKINRFDPKIVVVFHPVGIKSNININLINKNIIIIEDCVHQIVDINSIKINRKNHFVIDSLRKVVPLQGSNLIGRKLDLDFNEPSIFQSLGYSINVHLLWMVMLVFWNLKLYKIAERFMNYGYDLIGDSKLSANGFWLFNILSQFIDYKKVYNIKTEQVKIYSKFIKSDIKINKSDWKNLRGYPVKVNNQILQHLRDNKLFVRYELSDSSWGAKNNTIYLPLGPYISYAKIHEICTLYQLASSTQDSGV